MQQRKLEKMLADVSRCIENNGEYQVITIEQVKLCGYGRGLPCRYQTEKFIPNAPFGKSALYLCQYDKPKTSEVREHNNPDG